MKNKNIRNILVICEGNSEEILLNIIFDVYPITVGFDIFQYKTNVHLFWKFFKECYIEEGSVIDDIDIIQLLKDFRYEKILDNKFTDILLIFDFDPQDPRYDPDGLIQLQELFCESTDQGQLYINYPMIESLLDFTVLPDPEYLNKEVSKTFLYRHGYKNHVTRISAIGLINNINEENFPIILGQTYQKLLFLVTNDYDKYVHLLKLQTEKLMLSNRVNVINTCVLFLLDYNIQTFLNYIRD